MNKVTILGVEIGRHTLDEAMRMIAKSLQIGHKTTVVTVNPEIIMKARQNEKYRRVLNSAEISVADGIGVLWAANVYQYQPKLKIRLLRCLEVVGVGLFFGATIMIGKQRSNSPIPQRTTGVDLSYRIAEFSAKHDRSIFLLGAQPGVAQLAAVKLTELYPGLDISGVYAGQGTPDGDSETLQQLRRSPSDIVMVAFGAPKQEYWISRNLNKVPQSLAIGVGGTFMFISGKAKRAPQIIRRIGLEWLFRLATQPWRWKRQLVLPKFMLAVIADKVTQQ